MGAGPNQDVAIPLLALAVGRSARIAPAEGRASIPSRLEDLGFVPGTRLRVICLRAEQVAGLMVLPDRSDSRE